MSEAVAILNLIMTTLIVSEESLATHARTHAHTNRQYGPRTISLG